MRLYEIVYIFDATLDEGSVNKKLETFHPLVLGSDGEVVQVDHWGVRQLAYPVNKEKTGYYVVSQIRTGSQGLPEFERILKLDADVMRYLIVVNEGEPVNGSSIMGEHRPETSTSEGHDDRDRSAVEDESSEDERPAQNTSPPEFSGGRGRRRRMEGPVIKLLNYKDVSTLSQFMTEQGKILPKRTTKVTAQFQRQLGRAIKRARYLALIPYVRDHEA